MKKSGFFCFIIFSILVPKVVLGTEFYQGTFEEAIKKASSENKKILLYFTAKWCGPCRKMENITLSSDSVSNFIHANFVALKFDIDSHYGERFQKKYLVQALPAIVIISHTGEVIDRRIGFLTSRELLELLNVANSENSKTESSVFGYSEAELQKKAPRNFMPEIGVRLGVNYSSLTSYTKSGRAGVQSDIFISMELGRFLIRPGFGYVSRGNNQVVMKSLIVPIDLGYTFYKSAFFGLPGGIRAIGSTYYSVLLNDVSLIDQNDFGFRGGVSAYIGETSKLELQLSFEKGVPDLIRTENGIQRSKSVNLSLALTI